MKQKALPLQVGKRGREDNQKIQLPGTLILPDSYSPTLLLVQAGMAGYQESYLEHFAAPLANDFSVYVTQLRKGGFVNNNTSIEDFIQIDEQVRQIAEPHQVIYIGHSMGAGVSLSAKEQENLEVNAAYAIATFPSYGDVWTRNQDLKRTSLLHQLIDYTAKKTKMGPIQMKLKDLKITTPIRFAIGGNDWVTHTQNKTVRKRFIQYFSKLNDSSYKVFIQKNHCFNHRAFDHNPFNRDEPESLIRDVREFVYKTISSQANHQVGESQ